ncbi:MAG: hypothetical protein JXR73_08605, partial [Candidatus Omnitrophica bacterium]|nr:hypothetical protein [Candidatus Omnitrophota bacterium]
PRVLFLNACSSSSRGRYSSGFAAGLHDLGMCVLGYHSDIYDDDKPLIAADSFYRSLCVDQSLQNPQLDPNVITAIGAARRRLRDQGETAKPAWGSLRAYLPSEISFTVRGRGIVERSLQHLYSRFAQWMNPLDYTDHLSIGFQFAVLFGVLMGFINLAFIFPETLLVRHYTYQEIVSEILRIFLVGPLSFLAAAIFSSFLTLQNHRFLRRRSGKIPLGTLFKHVAISLPVLALSGAAFCALFTFSFSRLELLTAQITVFSGLTQLSIDDFWYRLIGGIGGTVSFSLLLASVFCLRRKETLHSYRTFYWVSALYGGLFLLYLCRVFHSEEMSVYRTGGWMLFILLNIVACSSVVIKTLKEISWRAMQKSEPSTQLSWRKLLPLLGGAFLVAFCFYLLEEAVRFEQHTVQAAILQRKASLETGEFSPHIEKILERALRQRAIHEIPDSVLDGHEDIVAAKQDWLLSLVCADYLLYRAQQRDSKDALSSDLARCQEFLYTGEILNAEVKFKDYYCNIAAMVEMLKTRGESDEARQTGCQLALANARKAVEKDERNFAYLDTLARVEAEIGEQNNDPDLLRQAAGHVRKAQWRAFFLRSPKADEVRRSIDQLAESIQQRIQRMEESRQNFPRRIYP